MIYHYVVTLKNKQTRYLDLIGLLLSLLSLFFFLMEMISSRSIHWAYLIGSVFIAGYILWALHRSYRLHKKVYYSRALLIAALVWMKMPYFQWLCLVFVVLALLEYQAKYAIEIGFTDHQVLINTLFKKKYDWSQFNNVILKDGVLTLDFANNKVLQKEILDEEDDDADEDEFNDYCRQRLLAAGRLSV